MSERLTRRHRIENIKEIVKNLGLLVVVEGGSVAGLTAVGMTPEKNTFPFAFLGLLALAVPITKRAAIRIARLTENHEAERRVVNQNL